MKRALVVAFLAIASAQNIVAQADSKTAVPRYRARLLGTFDETSGEPIKGVRVLDIATGVSAETSETGTVALFFVPDGGSLLRIQKIGYEVQTLLVAISPSDTTPVTIVLRHVTELAPVVTKAPETPMYISPRLRGFEERRKQGFGSFISDSVLRANEGHLLANVLMSRAPGITIRQGAGSANYLLQSPHCVGGGPPQVVLDGVPMSPDPPPNMGISGGRSRPVSMDNVAFDLTKFDVSTLAGVEWYPDNDIAPIEFTHTSARCGLLLLWTRER
ncbi:MAG: hypothetical protein ACREPM_08615 [Gemmatimonadaceae bacterium]